MIKLAALLLALALAFLFGCAQKSDWRTQPDDGPDISDALLQQMHRDTAAEMQRDATKPRHGFAPRRDP